MWHGIAFSSFCAVDLHLQRTGTISITTGMAPLLLGRRTWLSPPRVATTTIATTSDKVKAITWHTEVDSQVIQKQIKDNHMAPAGCHTHRHASRDNYKTWSSHTSHISHHTLVIPHHMPLEKQVRRLYFVVANFTWLLGLHGKSIATYETNKHIDLDSYLTRSGCLLKKPQK